MGQNSIGLSLVILMFGWSLCTSSVPRLELWLSLQHLTNRFINSTPSEIVIATSMNYKNFDSRQAETLWASIFLCVTYASFACWDSPKDWKLKSTNVHRKYNRTNLNVGFHTNMTEDVTLQLHEENFTLFSVDDGDMSDLSQTYCPAYLARHIS